MEETFSTPQKKYSPEEILLEKEGLLRRFRDLRFDFIEEFPPEKLSSKTPNLVDINVELISFILYYQALCEQSTLD